MRPFIILLLFLGLTACANLSTFEQPRVTVTDVRLRGGHLLAQEFLVTLRIDNPNKYGFDVNGVAADVLINGQPLARGLSNRAVHVPGFGSADITLTATVSTPALLQQLIQLGTYQGLEYEIRGHLNVGRDWLRDIRVPFEAHGSLDFWRFIDEQAIPRPLNPE